MSRRREHPTRTRELPEDPEPLRERRAPSVGLTVLVPTRNEADNVREFTRRACAALNGAPFSWNVLFVDDSDDHTPEVIEQLRNQGAPVDCIHRLASERIGTIAGAITAGLAKVDAAAVVVIDADLQHPPEILPLLVGTVLAGQADVAYGTRYSAGGSAAGLSSGWRRAASRASNLVTRALFPRLRHCSDPGSGLFCFDMRVIEGVELRPRGFKMLTEVLVRGSWSRLTSVPYEFEARVGGLSNATVRDGVDFGRHLLRLRATTGVRLGRVLQVPANELSPQADAIVDLREQPTLSANP